MTTHTPPLERERAAEALDVPLASALGLELLDPQAPHRGVIMPVGGLSDNGAGGLHASALSAAMELAGFLAVAPRLEPDEHAVTHASSVQLIAGAAQGDRVEVTASLDRRGKRIAFVSVVAMCEDRIVARAQLAKSIVARR